MTEFHQVFGSSHVDAIAYDPETRECRVRFRNGSIYLYEEVSAETFDQLSHAPSKGRFVNVVLRRAHRYRKESGE